MQELVAQQRHLTAAQIRDQIIRAAQAFTGNAELEDDRTLLVLRYTGVAANAQIAEALETLRG